MSPIWPKRAPRGAQRGLKTAPRPPKSGPSLSEEAILRAPTGGGEIEPIRFLLDSVQDGPRRAGPPRGSQEGPKRAQRSPKRTQRPPTLPQEGSTMTPRSLQEALRAKEPQKPSWLTPVVVVVVVFVLVFVVVVSSLPPSSSISASFLLLFSPKTAAALLSVPLHAPALP